MRYWWQSTVLLLAIFVLVACSGAAPDAESISVAVPSMTPILPTSSPPPSATPLPTETATLTPTLQPTPTLRPSSEPSPTPQPTEVPPTPTPEGPDTYGLKFTTATEAEIAAAIEKLPVENIFPLKYDSGIQGYELWGVLANSEIVDIEFEGGYRVVYMAEFHYQVGGETQMFNVNLLTTLDEINYVRLAQVAFPREKTNKELIQAVWPGLLSKPTVPMTMKLNGPIDNEPPPPAGYEWIIQPNTFLKPIWEQLGFDSEAMQRFAQTGDATNIPELNGRKFLPIPWMFEGD